MVSLPRRVLSDVRSVMFSGFAYIGTFCRQQAHILKNTPAIANATFHATSKRRQRRIKIIHVFSSFTSVSLTGSIFRFTPTPALQCFTVTLTSDRSQKNDQTSVAYKLAVFVLGCPWRCTTLRSSIIKARLGALRRS